MDFSTKVSIMSAFPVIGQVMAFGLVKPTKDGILREIAQRDPKSLVSRQINVSELEHFKKIENRMLIGSIFQAVVSVGLAVVLKWSVLGIGGMVLGVGYFVVSLYWRWQTSRYIGSETLNYHQLFQQTIRDKYTNWKSTFIAQDKIGLVAINGKGAQSEYNQIFPNFPPPHLIPKMPKLLTELYEVRTEWEKLMVNCFWAENDFRVPFKHHPPVEKAFSAFQAAMDKYLALQF